MVSTTGAVPVSPDTAGTPELAGDKVSSADTNTGSSYVMPFCNDAATTRLCISPGVHAYCSGGRFHNDLPDQCQDGKNCYCD